MKRIYVVLVNETVLAAFKNKWKAEAFMNRLVSLEVVKGEFASCQELELC
jgi:hypothetical protein